MAERVAASTAAQRADAFIDAIIMPVLDNKLLPTSGAPATICVTVPLTRLQNPTAATNHGDIADRLADGTLRLGSASIQATNGPAESVISSLAASGNLLRRERYATHRDDTSRQTTRHRAKTRSSRDKSGPHSSFATAKASTQPTNRVLGPTGTTSSTGHAADQPAWTTSPYSAPTHHHKIHTDNIPITIDTNGKPESTPDTQPKPNLRQDCHRRLDDAGTGCHRQSVAAGPGLSTAS